MTNSFGSRYIEQKSVDYQRSASSFCRGLRGERKGKTQRNEPKRVKQVNPPLTHNHKIGERVFCSPPRQAEGKDAAQRAKASEASQSPADAPPQDWKTRFFWERSTLSCTCYDEGGEGG